VIQLHGLSEDFSKIVMLEEDRFVEFHTKEGNYFKVLVQSTAQ